MSKGAIFLDRDGVINECAGAHQHITCRKDFHFLPGALDALAFLAQNFGGQIVIVTNQGVGAENMDAQADIHRLHDWMIERIEEVGGRIDGIWICPHRPQDHCSCRKPKPELILNAAEVRDIDLSQSVMVGDQASDLRAAWAAGIPKTYLVLTGHSDDKWPASRRDYRIYADLMAAARAIVREVPHV